MADNDPVGRPVGARARWAIVLASLAIVAVAVLTVVVLNDDNKPSGTAPAPSATVMPLGVAAKREPVPIGPSLTIWARTIRGLYLGSFRLSATRSKTDHRSAPR